MLCILGPTASGKSSLAMSLAQTHPNIELISMDSALVYRGMDIGTAKPSREEQQQVAHHLIDILDPAESYSAARFVADAQQAVAAICGRNKTPVIVGGTMLYYKALIEGLDDLPSAPAEIRNAIGAEALSLGWPEMHRQLATIDPETAGRLNPNDAQRISRALELYRFTGRTMSALIAESHQRESRSQGFDHLAVIALMPEDRVWLHERIATRFHDMLKQGFLDEVRTLMQRGDLHPGLPSMRCVGYRQAWDFLSGKTSQGDFVAAAIAATRQLAKRQITWLRGFTGLTLIDPKTSMRLARDTCNNLLGGR
ncbi:MAG: tRNA (adenosine(37)-N6)-dimethylallyltransferase MiaA [Burkholderiaceae bacterium]|nr:tRNA (adenosine(37)-N6)-dimethylallyltransferase MiaA [Burkholderiaceae bacterium]